MLCICFWSFSSDWCMTEGTSWLVLGWSLLSSDGTSSRKNHQVAYYFRQGSKHPCLFDVIKGALFLFCSVVSFKAGRNFQFLDCRQRAKQQNMGHGSASAWNVSYSIEQSVSQRCMECWWNAVQEDESLWFDDMVKTHSRLFFPNLMFSHFC